MIVGDQYKYTVYIDINNNNVYDSNELSSSTDNYFYNGENGNNVRERIISEVKFNDNYKYLIRNNSITILEYLGNDINVVIPSKIDKFPVIEIGEDAFQKKNRKYFNIRICYKKIRTIRFSKDY